MKNAVRALPRQAPWCAWVVALIIACGVRAAPASAQGAQQRPPFLAVVEKLVEAIADPRPERIGELAEAHFAASYAEQRTPDAREREFAALNVALGAAELVGVLAEQPGRRRVILRSGVDGATYHLDLEVTSEMPPRVRGMTLTRPAPLAEVSVSELAKRLRTEVDAEVAEMGFSGVVLVTRGEENVLEIAHGLANGERGIPNGPEIRYNLGSGDKLFTKIAIGQLLSAGRLALSDTVGRFLPDHPNEAVRRNVTIEHLLRHTSGLGSHLAAAVAARDRRIQSLGDLLALVSNESPAFEPGTANRYSNTGYLLLGRILEVVTGESYFDYVRRNIFEPAGMRATGYPTIDEWPADRAMGYTAAAPGNPLDFEGTDRQTVFRPHTSELPYVGSSAGGGYSTVRDIARLDRELREGRLMAADLEPLMFRRSPDRRRTLVANGGAPGVQFQYRRAGEYTVILFANIDPPSGARLADRLVGVLGTVK